MLERMYCGHSFGSRRAGLGIGMMVYGLKPMPIMRHSVGVDCRDRYRFVDREDGGEYGFLWPTSAFAAEGGGKLPESIMAW